MSTTFTAEIRNVAARKTASGDKEIVLKIVTDDETALALAHVPADATVQVSVS